MPVRRQRPLTPTERALWERSLLGATPLHGRAPVAIEPPPAADEAKPAEPRRPPATVRMAARRAAALDPERPVGLDRRSWLRLKRGQVVIDGVLDLHGRTQEQAHRALLAFIERAQGEGRRCILVVTGKGEPSGGVLRHMVPRWLNEGAVRERVIAYCAAQRHHGGAGALYVLLKRRRSA